jgi:hypothetical protein
MISFLSLFIISSLSFAQECKISRASNSDPSSFEQKSIEANKSVSYFDKSGPLSDFKIQDQDGLGTCYANALTAALKVSHSSHPDVSYLHASFLGSEARFKKEDKVIQEKTIDVNGMVVKINELFNHGGFVCGSFEAMKKAGGACPSNFSLIENDPNQKNILSGLGKYLDYLDGKEGKEKKEFVKDFSLLLKDARESLNLKKQECKEKKKTGFNPIDTLVKSIKYTFNSANESSCTEKINEFIRSLFHEPSEDSLDPFLGEPKEEFIQVVKEFFDSENALDLITDHLKSKQKMDKNSAFIDALEKKIKEKMQDNNCQSEPLFPENLREIVFNQVAEDFSKHLLLDCEKMDLSVDGEEASLACLPEELMSVNKDLIASYEAISQFLGGNFLKELAHSEIESSLDLLEAELMPGCQISQNLISLESLNCSSVDKYKYIQFCQPDGTCEWKIDTRQVYKSYQDKIFSSLDKNKGVSVSVCTSFMVNETFNPTELCEKKSDGIEGHSYHAMSITGYRCVNGKIQYQLLNSWGQNCPPAAGDSLKNDFMECDLDSEGRPRGSFWVNEEILFDSTTAIDSID